MEAINILMIVGLAILGATFGSFAGAQVWRLRASQLVEDKKNGEEVDSKEYKRLLPLTKRRLSSDRSIDLDTGKRLPWYDLIPVISWLMLRGKSRFSGKPIGWFELAIELSLAAFFVLSYIFWPYGFDGWVEVTQFVLWLASGVGLAILFAYDAKWFLLPNKIVLFVIVLGLISSALTITESADVWDSVKSIGGGILVLSGLYFMLFFVSRGKWIGFGDVKLGFALALLLADWRLAVIALFAANLIGSIIVIPGMIAGKIKRQARIPFGPLLITGWAIAGLFGLEIINWYSSFFPYSL